MDVDRRYKMTDNNNMLTLWFRWAEGGFKQERENKKESVGYLILWFKQVLICIEKSLNKRSP